MGLLLEAAVLKGPVLEAAVLEALLLEAAMLEAAEAKETRPGPPTPARLRLDSTNPPGCAIRSPRRTLSERARCPTRTSVRTTTDIIPRTAAR
jgi:hypothetical protein